MCWPTLVFQLRVLLHCVEEGHISRITTQCAELKTRTLDACFTGMPSTARASTEERRGCVRVFEDVCVCVCVCVCNWETERVTERWERNEKSIGILHKLIFFVDVHKVRIWDWLMHYPETKTIRYTFLPVIIVQSDNMICTGLHSILLCEHFSFSWA